MGNYVAQSDIDARLPGGYPENYTSTKVAEEISKYEAEVDTYVGVRYTVPVTSAAAPNSFKVLKGITSDLVYGTVLFELRQVQGEEAQRFPSAIIARAYKKLEMISAGDLLLVDATANTDDPLTPDDGYGDLTTAEKANITPIFTRGMEF